MNRGGLGRIHETSVTASYYYCCSLITCFTFIDSCYLVVEASNHLQLNAATIMVPSGVLRCFLRKPLRSYSYSKLPSSSSNLLAERWSWSADRGLRQRSTLAGVHHHQNPYRQSVTTYDFTELERSVPQVEFSRNSYELARHGRGESHHETEAPDVVAYPSTVEEVQEIIKYCVRFRIPVIPFGAGTSLEGHLAARHGGLTLDMKNFKSIHVPTFKNDDDRNNEINNTLTFSDPIAVVGAGVTRKTLNTALRHTGFQFVVDPGADATLGGMVATGASGTTTVRFGGMRNNILALECVLPNEEATIVKTGTLALKNSAGYDLTSLLCGSEGTLGVITSITVKLHPIPSYIMAVVCVFDSLHHAAETVSAIKLHDIPIIRCELLDEVSVHAFNRYNQSNRPEQPTLFLEVQGLTENSIHEQVAMLESICVGDHGGSSYEFAVDEATRKALWSARHSLYPASIALRPGATSGIVTDACVPLSHFATLIEETAKDVKLHNVVGPCFGHAGDGNLHCILPVLDDESDAYWDRLQIVQKNLIERTLAMGGTCTGEHGVGYGKIKYLKQQYGPGAIHMMQTIKRALDPYNIMNPGKIVLV